MADYIYKDEDLEEAEEKAGEGKPKQQTPEEMLSVIRLWNAALGGQEITADTEMAEPGGNEEP